MPVMTYPAAITLIDSAAEAHSALRFLSKEHAVGFDTETRPSFRKGLVHKMALMQISTLERCFLFRLNKIGICSELKKFLENPDIIKIGLSLHDDFKVLSRTASINPQGFVDLQKMVAHYDISDISLQKVYAIIFGERISKSQRLTNWEAETLSGAQQAYAALDAWACLRIYNSLTSGEFDPLTSPFRHIEEPPQLGGPNANRK
ncbi:MAG: 3'-5' exonuclease domain-containing protein 2 [Muribaculaceae bacterium]|nr:3'-5' exonuclease domain-containing protein 2 [Muribaculaceae bacterium]